MGSTIASALQTMCQRALVTLAGCCCCVWCVERPAALGQSVEIGLPPFPQKGWSRSLRAWELHPNSGLTRWARSRSRRKVPGGRDACRGVKNSIHLSLRPHRVHRRTCGATAMEKDSESFRITSVSRSGMSLRFLVLLRLPALIICLSLQTFALVPSLGKDPSQLCTVLHGARGAESRWHSRSSGRRATWTLARAPAAQHRP